MNKPKILDYYPFPNIGIELLQGYKETASKGHFHHHGIDFILREGVELKSFPVHSMHAGMAYQGHSPKWGRFVVVRVPISHHKSYESVYGHLEHIDNRIPPLENEGHGMHGLKILPQFLLGHSSGTGETNGLIQLHLQVHEIDMQTGERSILDPYGIYGEDNHPYPQPGESLEGLLHLWSSNNPPFAGQATPM